jgi:protein gp37
MRKTTIEWCDASWNPVTGCFHRCPYCYNLREGAPLSRYGTAHIEGGKLVASHHTNWRKRETGKIHIASKHERCPHGYDPTFYPDRLQEPLKIKKPKRIFVVSAGDLWGDWVPNEWIEKVLDVIRKSPWHVFQCLTKNPRRYLDFELPQNSWAGATVTCDEDYERAKIMKKVKAPVKFLSIEPLLGEVGFDLRGIDWLIIGAMTGNNPLRPKRHWIERILSEANRLGIPVFLKNNLRPYYPFSIQQFPY